MAGMGIESLCDMRLGCQRTASMHAHSNCVSMWASLNDHKRMRVIVPHCCPPCSQLHLPPRCCALQHCSSINAICVAHDLHGVADVGRSGPEADDSLSPAWRSFVFTGSRDGTVKRWHADMGAMTRAYARARTHAGDDGEGVEAREEGLAGDRVGSRGSADELASPREQMAALLRAEHREGQQEGEGNEGAGGQRRSGAGSGSGSSSGSGRRKSSDSNRRGGSGAVSGSGGSSNRVERGGVPEAQLQRQQGGGVEGEREGRGGVAGWRDGRGGAHVRYDGTFEGHTDWVRHGMG